MTTGSAAAERVYDFQETRLDNGLRVITLEDFSAPIAAVQVWYHVGSKNERMDRQGFAHMFEHMMFRGTDLLGPEDHFELIRGTGGTCNAFTSFDYTAYVNTVPANQLELAMWLEAERMMFLRIDEEGFHTERNVVIEERRQDLNEPYGTVFEQLMPVVYQEHPYRWLPIGRIDHLNEAEVDELHAFWDAHYVPANATMVIVGAVEHEQAQKMARKYFGWMPKLPKPEEVSVREPAQEEEREVTIYEGIGPVPLVRYVYRAVPKDHPDHIVLQALSDILGSGESSRLYKDLVKEKKVSQQAFSYLWGLEHDGLLMAGAELMPDGDLETVLAALDEEIAEIAEQPVDERELEKVKNQLRRRIVTETLEAETKARAIGRSVIQEGTADALNQKLAQIEAITVEDVQRAAEQYLREDNRTVVRVLPDKERAAERVVPEVDPVEEAAGSDYQKADVKRPEWFPKEPPVSELLDALPQPEKEAFTLENGLKVVVLPNHETPFVTMMMGLKNGAWTEDPETPGAAAMALSMLKKGTENYTAAELAEKIEYNALTLSGQAGFQGSPEMDVGSVSATGLTEKAPLALELMSEIVQRPTFPEDELQILKDQMRLNLSVKENDPRYLASRALRRELYGKHPYARTPSGELADMDAIDRDAVREWWAHYLRPERAVLYIAGDMKPERAREVVKQHFGAWKAEKAPEAEQMPPVPENNPTAIYVLDRPGAPQSQIRVGQVSLTRTHPDYHSAQVFSQIFGGGFNSRLNRVIRVERGLTYGAFGYFNPNREAGSFIASTFTKTESTAETVQAVLDVIDSMASDPPAKEEVQDAKAYLVGSFARRLETPRSVMAYQWLIEYNDLSEDYLQQAVEGYKATTSEDLARIAEEIIDTNRLAIVVVGDAEKIVEELRQIAPVVVVEEADAEDAQNAETQA